MFAEVWGLLVRVPQRNRSNTVFIQGESFILRKWLMQLWGWLACAKSAGGASWLESPGRADVAVVNPKTQNSFFFGEVSVFLLKP